MLSLEVAQVIDAGVKDWFVDGSRLGLVCLDEMEKGWSWSGRRREVDGGGRRDGEKDRSQKPEMQRLQKTWGGRTTTCGDAYWPSRLLLPL